MFEPLILVVDDEDQLAMFTSTFLQRDGYRTIKATSGQQALDLFTDEVDALLTDWTMPGLSGERLALKLLEQKPSLRVLFMSGNAASSVKTSFPLEPGVNFIQKPFGAADLLSFVNLALRAPHKRHPHWLPDARRAERSRP